MWTPMVWRACWGVIREKKVEVKGEGGQRNARKVKLVRMVHANLDPVRYRFHGWKKRLVAPIERWLFRRTDEVVVTCEVEKEWCEAWGLKNEFRVMDLKKFFNFARSSRPLQASNPPNLQPSNLHVLYLGRRHPLKGVEYLEQAVEEVNRKISKSQNRQIDLRVVSDAFGEEKERVWEWCEVLVLPTLSENFGLVVAEALERGKRVITTDGAPVWEGQEGVVYLKGFRDGTRELRVRLLKEAIEKFLGF